MSTSIRSGRPGRLPPAGLIKQTGRCSPQAVSLRRHRAEPRRLGGIHEGRQSVARISEELGIHVVTLYNWRMAWGLTHKPDPRAGSTPSGAHRAAWCPEPMRSDLDGWGGPEKSGTNFRSLLPQLSGLVVSPCRGVGLKIKEWQLAAAVSTLSRKQAEPYSKATASTSFSQGTPPY